MRRRSALNSSTFRQRSGVVLYASVLGTTLLVSLMALAGLNIVRIQRQQIAVDADRLRARTLANSAIELALKRIATDATWRTTLTSGVETTSLSLGTNSNGTISWLLVDSDGNLANADVNLQLKGIGRVGDAVQVSTISLANVVAPLDILSCSVHATGEVNIKSGKQFGASGAPASSNYRVHNNGTIWGDVDAVALTGSGTVTGAVTAPAPVKTMPAASVFNDYLAIATTLPFSGNFDKDVLTPTVNQYGGSLNSDGVYYINTAGNDLTIKGSRIHGTLLIDAGNNRVTIDNQVFLHSYRADFPVLIVRGFGGDILDIKISSQGSSSSRYLEESAWGTNFNPTGAPYNGQTDSDQGDRYPSEIQGLVYVDGGSVRLFQSAIIRGALVVNNGGTSVEGNSSYFPTIIHTPSLVTNPPAGFTYLELQMTPGSWVHDAAPQ